MAADLPADGDAELSSERPFLSFGGPTHRLGAALHLVRDGTNTVPLGLALGWGLWAILMGLAILGGEGPRAFSLSLVGGHVRLLVAIPLFFVCESLFEPRAEAFLRTLVRSGVVPDSEQPRLETSLRRGSSWRRSWLPEALFLALSLAALFASPAHLGSTAGLASDVSLGDLSLAGLWYWFVCLPVFRFLILRWVWRLAWWAYLLWEISRLRLQLNPAHSDGAAGLGFLESVHSQLFPLMMALSAVQAAALAEGIAAGARAMPMIYVTIAATVALELVIVIAPLLLFAFKLYQARDTGLIRFSLLASEYAEGFAQKWMVNSDTREEPLVGTGDIQSMADLGTSFEMVKACRIVPISQGMLMQLILAGLAPMAPIVLLLYPLDVVARRLFSTLLGI